MNPELDVHSCPIPPFHFSELILGKNKLGISEKWKGGIGTEVFCRKALRKESLEGNFENVRGLGAAWE